MLKSDLRKIYKAQRLALSMQERNKYDDLLLIQFQQMHLQIPDYVMTYASFEKYSEFDPGLIQDYCCFRNPAVSFIYPVVEDNILQAVKTDADTAFTENEMGIDEPVDGIMIEPTAIDMIFVPLLICDLSGYRVGYGKGFYDRFLKLCRKDVVTIGFSYFEPIQKISDVYEGDVPLNYLVTPTQFYPF